jgi:hypothetical protein
MDRLELMACIEEPIAELDLRKEQQAELVEVALWEAIDRLARFSQELVISRVSVFMRLEAI